MLQEENNDYFFEKLKTGLFNIDPVTFCENNLTLDGKPFRLNGNGYKPFADIYRYIGVKALEKDSKPIVLVKGRQVGATTMACALELFFMASGLFGKFNKPPMRIMHCFPFMDLAAAYTKTKLNPMITGAVMGAKVNGKNSKKKSVIEEKFDNSTKDSIWFKQFENGNHIWIESTGLTGDRIRGRTVDCMFMDEIQDMKKAALANAIKLTSQSQYGKRTKGIQVYFGTPKQAGGVYYDIWKNSNQQIYHLGCSECNEFFPLYTPGSDDWESIWIHGHIVKCTKCGFEQNKLDAAERGKWIATNPNYNAEYLGFHINQLFNPQYTREDIEAEKPENSPINTERAYRNEVLGEFYSNTNSTITAEEIELKCADKDRKFTSHISINETRKVYIGFDWGQKNDIEQKSKDGDEVLREKGQSYSCAVVLTADNPYILSIEFAMKFKKNDPTSKKEIVDELFRRYNPTLCCGDIGDAQDLSYILQKEYGDRFLTSRAVGKIKNHIKFAEDVFPKEIQFDRNHYVRELFEMMKAGKIRFPFGSYEQIGWLINHCSSMELKKSIDKYGDVKEEYVKGLTQNDGFCALQNALLLHKFDITNGFKIINPNDIQINSKGKKSILACLGYLPNRRS